MKLPLIESRTAETTLCTYCPKLCRPACPVSTVEGRETVSPWGKMRAMGELGRSVVPADESHMAPVYACTGCLRCGTMCELDNPVADALRDGRADALASGSAPAAVRALVERLPARETALAHAAEALGRRGGSVAYFPGCTAVTFEREGVVPIADAVSALDRPCGVVAGVCCGLPWLEAGDREGFVQRANATARVLEGYARVVTTDAGCAHAMRVLYPRFGVSVPAVLHLAEVAAAAIDTIPALGRGGQGVAYHDPCRLGRGLGVYDEPRKVLTKLYGEPPREFREHGVKGACSGAGGLLPVSRPATSAGMAREVAELAAEVQATVVVTACPASRRQLAGAGLRTEDFGALVAEAVRSDRR